MWRWLITEIRHEAFLHAKPLKFVGIAIQWLGYPGKSQKLVRTPSFLQNPSSSFLLWISGFVTRVFHRNTTGRLPFCETFQVNLYCESVARLRGLITEIRLHAILSAKHFNFICIVNQWIGYAGWSQKYDRTPSFLRTIQVRWYCVSVARLRRLITEIRLDAFLSAKTLNFVGIVNQLQGDAGWSQKYERKPSFLRTIQVRWYCVSVARLRRLSQKYDRTPSFLRNPSNLFFLVNQWLGDAGCSQKYDRAPSFRRNPSSSCVLWISFHVTRVDHRNTSGLIPFCQTLEVNQWQ
jgi:hypothetical protein